MSKVAVNFIKFQALAKFGPEQVFLKLRQIFHQFLNELTKKGKTLLSSTLRNAQTLIEVLKL